MWNDAFCSSEYEFICEINQRQIPSEDWMNKYYLSYPTRANWHEAFMFCKRTGRELVSIETIQKEKEIENFIKHRKLEKQFTTWQNQIWTSGTDQNMDNEFYWMSTGQKLTYTNFKAGGINNKQNGNNKTYCLGLYNFKGNGFVWNDELCWRNMFFICEKRPNIYSRSC